MNLKAQSVYRKLQKTYAQILPQLIELSKQLDDETSHSEMADIGYMAREFVKVAEELTKKGKQLHEKSQLSLCSSLMRHNTMDKIKTEYCSATPDIKQIVSAPSLRSNPEAFKKLMVDYFGIDPIFCMEFEAVRPNYNGVNDLVTSLTNSGDPLPDGLTPSVVHDRFVVTYRKRKGVLEE